MGFWERMEEIINKGITTTRDVLDKARDKTKELGEKGSLKFQMMQLESQAEKRFAQLGSKVFELLVKEGKNTVSKSTEEIKSIIDEIKQLEEKIDGIEEKMKKL